MTIADEIRAATARDELHPLVRTNKASPRGLCNGVVDETDGVTWCTRDYGHDGDHENDSGARALERIGNTCRELLGS